jgi:peptidoglycan hydrolase-like protein with peptidoglycan-binding domain
MTDENNLPTDDELSATLARFNLPAISCDNILSNFAQILVQKHTELFNTLNEVDVFPQTWAALNPQTQQQIRGLTLLNVLHEGYKLAQKNNPNFAQNVEASYKQYRSLPLAMLKNGHEALSLPVGSELAQIDHSTTNANINFSLALTALITEGFNQAFDANGISEETLISLMALKQNPLDFNNTLAGCEAYLTFTAALLKKEDTITEELATIDALFDENIEDSDESITAYFNNLKNKKSFIQLEFCPVRELLTKIPLKDILDQITLEQDPYIQQAYNLMTMFYNPIVVKPPPPANRFEGSGPN